MLFLWCVLRGPSWRCHRVQESASALKQLEPLLRRSGGGASDTGNLEREWRAEEAALQLKLQKHREGVVSRFHRMPETPPTCTIVPGGLSLWQGTDVVQKKRWISKHEENVLNASLKLASR